MNVDTASVTLTQQTPSQRRMPGFLLVVTGGILWGLSGTAAQELFHANGFHVAWLVCLRMWGAGLLLLLISQVSGQRPFRIFGSARSVLRLLIFTIFGLFAVQYTYFSAVDTGNAAAATFLQYTGPLFITLYFAIQQRRWPRKTEICAILLALFGTYLLVTGGSFKTLNVSSACIVWGWLSALALAFYTLYPGRLTAQYGLLPTAGWAMLIGGCVSACAAPPWHWTGIHWNMASAALTIFVIVFGTFVAFTAYLASLRYISATETSLLSGVEPLAAAFAGALWLHTAFTPVMAVGGFCIVGTVALLSFVRSRKQQPSS